MSADSAICPRCHQAAPTVVRGIETFCVACGAPRFPLTSVPVNLAGRPAKVGGSIARVLGWGTLAGGLGAAAIVGALLQVLFPLGVAGWIVGGVIAAFALGIGLLLLMGGQKLHLAGTGREREAALQAISALAARNGGAVTAEEVGRALRMPAARADALLTDLAKQEGERVRLEVDDAGQLLYYVDRPVPRQRVAAQPGAARIDVSPIPPSDDAEADAEASARREQRRR